MSADFIIGLGIGIIICITLIAILIKTKPDIIDSIVGGLKNVRKKE